MKKAFVLFLFVVVLLTSLMSCSGQKKHSLKTEDFRLSKVAWSHNRLALYCDFKEQTVKPVSVDFTISLPPYVEDVDIVHSENITDYTLVFSKLDMHTEEERTEVEITVSFSPKTPFGNWEEGILEVYIFGYPSNSFQYDTSHDSKVCYYVKERAD